MATYYVRADGSAANKAAATSDAAANTSMDYAKHNSETFSAGDIIIVSDSGGIYRASLIPPSSGSSGNPIVYQANADGSPEINGANDVTTATYRWIASGSGTNEYYVELSGGGDPSISDPVQVFMDNVRLTEATVGSLSDHEWDWADNDALGFSTIYVADAS